jgi:hypothetical protein
MTTLQRAPSARSVVKIGKRVPLLWQPATLRELAATAEVESVGNDQNDQHRERCGGCQDGNDRSCRDTRHQHQY